MARNAEHGKMSDKARDNARFRGWRRDRAWLFVQRFGAAAEVYYADHAQRVRVAERAAFDTLEGYEDDDRTN